MKWTYKKSKSNREEIKNEHEKIKTIFDKTQKITKPYVRLLTYVH